MICGYEATIFQLYNDVPVIVDTRYGTIPILPQVPTFPYLTANVMLPLTYPNFTPEVREAFMCRQQREPSKHCDMVTA